MKERRERKFFFFLLMRLGVVDEKKGSVRLRTIEELKACFASAPSTQRRYLTFCVRLLALGSQFRASERMEEQMKITSAERRGEREAPIETKKQKTFAAQPRSTPLDAHNSPLPPPGARICTYLERAREERESKSSRGACAGAVVTRVFAPFSFFLQAFFSVFSELFFSFVCCCECSSPRTSASAVQRCPLKGVSSYEDSTETDLKVFFWFFFHFFFPLPPHSLSSLSSKTSHSRASLPRRLLSTSSPALCSLRHGARQHW